MTQSTYINVLRYFFYILLACTAFILVVHFQKNILSLFQNVEWWHILLLGILHIPIIALGGFSFNILCGIYKIHLSFRDWFGLSFIANLLNQLLPYRPGIGFRFLYLKYRYQFTFSCFFNITLFSFLITLSASALIVCFTWHFIHLPQQFNKMFLTTGGIVLIMALIISLYFALPFLKSKIHALHYLIQAPGMLIKVLCNNLLVHFLYALSFFIACKAMNTPLSFLDCLFFSGIITAAQIFPITPGNIGLLELLFGMMTQVLYQHFSMGFSIVALYRGSLWITSFFLGTLFSFMLIGSMIPNMQSLKFGSANKLD